MNNYDLDFLKKRLAVLSGIVRDQHKLPKAERSKLFLADTLLRIQKIDGWISEHYGVAVKKAAPAAITKAEFKKRFKQLHNIEDPESIIVIDDIATLEEVWPRIRGQNIAIKIDDSKPEIKRRLKELVKRDRAQQRIPGFR